MLWGLIVRALWVILGVAVQDLGLARAPRGFVKLLRAPHGSPPPSLGGGMPETCSSVPSSGALASDVSRSLIRLHRVVDDFERTGLGEHAAAHIRLGRGLQHIGPACLVRRK